MEHFKCTFVHYANFNTTSLNKHCLRAVESAISFFQFSIYVYFNDAFVKTSKTFKTMNKLSFFNASFQNSF